jgi:hypothetical protein
MVEAVSMYYIEIIMATHIKLHYLKMILVVNMSNFLAIILACMICVAVVYLSNEHDIPRKFFLHGYECSGQIGGGCEKD